MKNPTIVGVLLLLVFLPACGPRAARPPVHTWLGDVPAEAFDPMNEAELLRFFEVLPQVMTASGWMERDSDDLELEELSDVFVLIDGLGSMPAVQAELRRGGTDWPHFRATMLRVTVAAAAILEDAFGGLISAIFGQEESTGADEDALSNLVPKHNIELLEKHEDTLERLGYLFELLEQGSGSN
jgi:hypothetical protein